ISSLNSGDTGAGENPQLPTTSVVTPWRILDSARRLPKSRQSECECMSMKPGATMRPEASRVCPAGSRARSPTIAMLSPVTPTSTRTAGVPVPSKTCPPVILRSSTRRFLEPDGALTPRGGGEETRLRPRSPRELEGKGQSARREAGGEGDRRHARGAPRRAEGRVAREGQALGRGARRGRRDERVEARGDRSHVGAEGAAVGLGGEIVHRPHGVPVLDALAQVHRILGSVARVEIAMEGGRFRAHHRVARLGEPREGDRKWRVLDLGARGPERLEGGIDLR